MMKAEILALVDRVLWTEGRPLRDLFNATQTEVPRPLAEFYGFPEPKDGVATYDMSSVPGRRGLLTQAGLLTIGGNRASLVERGLWMLETVLCGKVAAPPVDVIMEMGDVQPGATQRTYSEERMQNVVCGSCHSQMDPLAYGLERFDGIGAYRVQDEFGNPLRMDGALVEPGQLESQPFSEITEFMDLLAESPRVEECLVLKPTQFAIGRALVGSDGCTLVDVKDRFQKNGATYPALIRALTTTPTFFTVQGD